MYNFVVWAISKIGKSELLKIVWKVFRRIFAKLYDEVLNDVKAAELALPDGTGAQKAAWVTKRFLANHNELSEWRWVINILIEVAVGEVKTTVASSKFTEFNARLSKFTEVK